MGWGVSVYIETKLEMAHTQSYKFTGCTSSDCSTTLGRVCSLVGHLKRRWENMILRFFLHRNKNKNKKIKYILPLPDPTCRRRNHCLHTLILQSRHTNRHRLPRPAVPVDGTERYRLFLRPLSQQYCCRRRRRQHCQRRRSNDRRASLASYLGGAHHRHR